MAKLDITDPAKPVLKATGKGNLPGRRQTVNRAELLSAIKLFSKIAYGPVCMYTDSSYVVKGFNRTRETSACSNNGDLWGIFHDQLERLDHAVMVIKVKAHAEYNDLVAGIITPWNFFGNQLADVLAGQAADECQLNWGEQEGLRALDARTWLVQKRLLAVMMHIVEYSEQHGGIDESLEDGQRRSSRRIPATRKLDTWKTLHEQKGHKLLAKKRYWVCLHCNQRAGKRQRCKWARADVCSGKHAVDHTELSPDTVQFLDEGHEDDPFGHMARGMDEDDTLGSADNGGPVQPPPRLPIVSLPSRCLPPIVSLSRIANLQVGGRAINPTHAMHYVRCVFFCARCGSYCIDRPLRLVDPCPGDGGKGPGRCARSRLLKQKTPRPEMGWPAGVPDIPLYLARSF